MTWAPVGVIEGFYGRPWSWTERAEVARFCFERGMTDYLYAPKDDPRHRHRWRERYEPDELDGFAALVAQGTLRVGYAISPGLSIDYRASDDRAALAAKIDQVLATGVEWVALLVDDIPVRPGLGDDHAELTDWLHDHLDGRARLALVPTEYTGTQSTAYLDALADGVPAEVPIAWTGLTVVCDAITVEQAHARAAALGGRPPLLWDNYPVNDALMADRLFLGPLRGREPGLLAACTGFLANPMVQPSASKLPLASIAGFVRGEDPDAVWREEAGALRTFAEACDGEHPRRLVAAVRAAGPPAAGTTAPPALRELEAWLDGAAACTAPGLEGEVEAWLDQVHAEAQVGLCATRLLQALHGRDDARGRRDAFEQAMMLAFLWPAVRRSEVTVMGPRCSFRPVLGQWPDGEWALRPDALTSDENAVDHLARHALDALASRHSSVPPR